MKTLRGLAFLILGLSLCAAAAADDAVVRSYDLGAHGTLQLRLPAGWDEEVRRHPGDFPPTIVLSGFESTPFLIKITPLWSQPNAADFGSPDYLHDLVAKAAHAIEAQSVEGRLDLVRLGGAQSGYYFSATDRAPDPGDFKYLTQGAVRVGELVCTFTILTSDDKAPIRNQVLNLLSQAVHGRKK
jgi:hypothetical protein